MVNNKQQDVVRRARRTNRTGMSQFDGQRIAVILRRRDTKTVVCGKAFFVKDDYVGNSLQIRLDDGESGRPVLILSEREWNGRIIPDLHYGCKYSLVVE
jgi:hypothetical protein